MVFKPKYVKMALIGLAIATCTSFAGPVSYYGKIKAVGNRIKSEDGLLEVQLKGPSLFWSTLSADKYYNQQTVDWFVENMNISVIRAAMAIKYYKANAEPIYTSVENFGYLSPEVPNAKALMTERIERVVQAAILNDIYVIVDWHSHNAENETSEAVTFFKNMATKYKDVPNIIWEIYNEPNCGWSQIAGYANQVIDAIRNAGNNNLIIVGTSSWSQNPNEGSLSKTNIAYVLHFYAGTHGASLRSAGDAALNNSKAVFVSEWGGVNADGTGSINTSSSNEWISWMNTNKLSSCYWSILDNGDGHAIFNKNTGNNLSMSALSASGQLFKSFMGNGITAPTGYPSAKNISVSLLNGQAKTVSTELGISAGATITAVKPIDASLGTVAFTANSVTYTPPAVNAPGQVDVIYTVTSGGKSTKWRVSFKANRAPTVKDTDLPVSYRTDLPTPFTANLPSMGVTDPDQTVPTIVSITGGTGTVTISGDKTSFTYRPPAGFLGAELAKVDEFTYTVTDGVNQVSAKLRFVVQSFAPTALAQRTITLANTATQTVNRKTISAVDKDEDSLTFSVAEVMNAGYPATAVISADKKTVLFTPAPNMIGQAYLRLRVTDGQKESNDSYLIMNITGSGSQISAYQIPVGLVNYSSVAHTSMWMTPGSLQISSSVPVRASVQVYSIAGRKVADMFRGELAAGTSSLPWDESAFPKGVYVIKAQLGSAVKTLQFIRN